MPFKCRCRSATPLCHQCGASLSASRILTADDAIVFCVKHLGEIVSRGYATIEEKNVTANEYFYVLHHIIKMLASRKIRLSKWREAHGCCFEDAKVLGYFETLAQEKQAVLLERAIWLLMDLPSRFVHVCKQWGVRNSDIFQDMKRPPNWYRDTVLNNIINLTDYNIDFPSCDEANYSWWRKHPENSYTPNGGDDLYKEEDTI